MTKTFSCTPPPHNFHISSLSLCCEIFLFKSFLSNKNFYHLVNYLIEKFQKNYFMNIEKLFFSQSIIFRWKLCRKWQLEEKEREYILLRNINIIFYPFILNGIVSVCLCRKVSKSCEAMSERVKWERKEKCLERIPFALMG